MKPTTALKLSGAASQDLVRRTKDSKSELAKFSALFDFFTVRSSRTARTMLLRACCAYQNLPGLGELWELVDALVSNRPCTPENLIIHINDLRKVGSVHRLLCC